MSTYGHEFTYNNLKLDSKQKKMSKLHHLFFIRDNCCGLKVVIDLAIFFHFIFTE